MCFLYIFSNNPLNKYVTFKTLSLYTTQNHLVCQLLQIFNIWGNN